jgi:signal transduction histidine kinase/ligand-binding sensor domain-containing protein
VRVIYEDDEGVIWAGGVGGLAKLTPNGFVSVLDSRTVRNNVVGTVTKDHSGNLWIGGDKGLMRLGPHGEVTRFDARDGLTDNTIRALLQDRNGNLWVGTNFGLCRLEGSHFTAAPTESGYRREWVRTLFEDREGNLWVGLNRGLSQFHDELFTMYGRVEGLPSDEPVAIHQDLAGGIWVGYHGDGLVALTSGKPRIYTTQDGLPSNSIISIHDAANGDLLISTNGGLSRMHAGHLSTYFLRDQYGGELVWDAIEDRRGRLWAAKGSGVYTLAGGIFRNVVPGGPSIDDAAVVLTEGTHGDMWAGTYAKGLWHIEGGMVHHYTSSGALGSNAIRSLYQDSDGTLWIGTLGGGLSAFHNGLFTHYGAKNGLLSDNISHVEDDGKGSLWLSTTRGIARVSKSQLHDFAEGRITALTPTNYGVEDGLRSAQCAPAYQGGGGTRTRDGRIWFTTSRGIAAIDPGAPKTWPLNAPIPHVVEVYSDGRNLTPGDGIQFAAGTRFIRFRYSAIFLSAPARVRYSYRLDGLNSTWVAADGRQTVTYNTLPRGSYTFKVKAALPDAGSRETDIAFTVLPHIYQTAWFRLLAVTMMLTLVYWIYQIRVRLIHSRFSLVLQERTRIAREIHDTVVQALFGISAQLDVLSVNLDGDREDVRRSVDMARKMSRHSLIAARESVLDLRDVTADDDDLATALKSAVPQWVNPFAVPVTLDVEGECKTLSGKMIRDILRIVQEAVTNALMHANPAGVWVRLEMEVSCLRVLVRDNGRGFHNCSSFSASLGHFGLVGMRERAERVGGQLKISSEVGVGTEVELEVPL